MKAIISVSVVVTTPAVRQLKIQELEFGVWKRPLLSLQQSVRPPVWRTGQSGHILDPFSGVFFSPYMCVPTILSIFNSFIFYFPPFHSLTFKTSKQTNNSSMPLTTDICLAPLETSDMFWKKTMLLSHNYICKLINLKCEF